MPVKSEGCIFSTIERLAASGERLTLRNVRKDMLATHGRGASLTTIQPLLAAWKANHPSEASQALRASRTSSDDRVCGYQFADTLMNLFDRRIEMHASTMGIRTAVSRIGALGSELATLREDLRAQHDTLKQLEHQNAEILHQLKHLKARDKTV